MTREEAIERLKNIKSVPSMFIDEIIKELVEALQEPPTLADFLGLEEGQEYLLNDAEYCHPRIKVENDKIYHFHEDDKGWLEREYVKIDYINDYRQAKKVEKPKLKAWHVRDEYSFNCFMKELKEEGKTYCNDLTWEDVKKYEGNVVIYERINHLTYSNLHFYNISPRIQEEFDLIEYHKEEPRYLLQTDLISENGVQYLSFDKKRREYFMGALMTSENVQQQFTDSEISKIKSITRFVEFCEKFEVE